MVDVTVVLPVYNGFRKSEKYLTDAINSVLLQDYSSFELIIIDDGSTEDYTVLIDKYKNNEKVKFFRKENGGQSSARNYGAKLGSGKYLAFIDQDDVWYKNRLTETVRAFKANKNNNCVMVYSDLDRIDSKSRIVTKRFLREKKLGTHPKTQITCLLGDNGFILPGTMLVDRDQFLSLGGFNETLSGYEDDEISLRFFQCGELVFIEKPLIQWRIYQDSYSYSERMEKSFLNYFYILINEYPDDKYQGDYWVRDYIAPRFYYGWLHTFRMGLLKKNKNQAIRAKEGLNIVSNYLPLKKRIVSKTLAKLPYSVAKFIYATRIFIILKL
ncbi:glycosyltransferase [Acidithiobacillus sulfurivorans]|uniref:Glycosyltransferase n=1 Tax=Acidithiobacillus sulfurivorans TaxID=1958756 RepID=A0ABS5ZV16_9PROT|nr:glycosyltransferase [Acidithiobacillus sulfurivorans]MBU2759068.1 glycosyltransferase [Acidithiobacillus sulfurivorans]